MGGFEEPPLDVLAARALPPDSRAAELREFAARIQAWATSFELARPNERPHVASLMLACAVRLRGTALAYRQLADELENPTEEDLP